MADFVFFISLLVLLVTVIMKTQFFFWVGEQVMDYPLWEGGSVIEVGFVMLGQKGLGITCNFFFWERKRV